MLRTLVAFGLVLGLATASRAGEADPPAKLPAAAQATLDRLAKADAKLIADYRKALTAERTRAINDLDKLMKTVTRSGDLVGALAVKARLDELRAAQDADADDLLADKPAGLAAAMDPNRLVLGRWSLGKGNGTTGTVEFSPGGNAVVNVGPLTVAGRWRIEKERVRIVWAGDESKWEDLAFDGPDRMTGDSFDAGRNGITCSRLKQPAR